MRKECNAEGEAEASENDVEEVEKKAEAGEKVELGEEGEDEVEEKPKEPRKPRIKLGDIMGVIWLNFFFFDSIIYLFTYIEIEKKIKILTLQNFFFSF